MNSKLKTQNLKLETGKLQVAGGKSQVTSQKLRIAAFLLILSLLSPLGTVAVQAQVPSPETDISKPTFKLLICDGPEQINHIDPKSGLYKIDNPKNNPNFIPCDFNGAMMQIQHFINVAMIVGVLVAVLGFTKAGIYFIWGEPGKIKEAKETFAYVVKGFIIMLSAWFIVYQILAWLLKSNTLGVLLATPK